MKKYFLIVVLSTFFFSCKKSMETLTPIVINDLYPITVGKTFIYRLDSTLPINFGASLATKSYQAKDSVESNFMDASGRNSFRIFRYLRDTLGIQPWTFTATYYTTIETNKIEYNDNNLRFITLVNPVSYNTSWKGNAYINTILPSPFYYFDNWDYHYTKLDEPFTCIKGNIQNTYTVLQQNTKVQQGNFNPSFYDEKNYSIEVYAKGIGLIYKDFIHYTWQPTPAPARFQDDSWGIRLNLIENK
ncbi:MAG: hypothetical protein ACOVO1_07920 [Chitinophagaceae bacterium]